ncbi:unnamed protein product, partial [Owenia fusiformis]
PNDICFYMPYLTELHLYGNNISALPFDYMDNIEKIHDFCRIVPTPGNVRTIPTSKVTTKIAGGTTLATQQSVQTIQQTDQSSQRSDQTTQGSDQTTQGSDQTTQGSDKTTQVSDQTTQGSDQTTRGSDQTTQGSDQTTQQPNQTLQLLNKLNSLSEQQHRDHALIVSLACGMSVSILLVIIFVLYLIYKAIAKQHPSSQLTNEVPCYEKESYM